MFLLVWGHSTFVIRLVPLVPYPVFSQLHYIVCVQHCFVLNPELSTPYPHSFVFLPATLVLHILPVCYYPGCSLIISSQKWPSREVVKLIPKRILVTNLNFSFLKETNIIPFVINRSSCLGETISSSVPKTSNPRKKNLSWRKTQN